jgi:hypothetical protein
MAAGLQLGCRQLSKKNNTGRQKQMKRADVLKSFTWRTFFQSLLFSTLLFAVVACFYWQSQDLDAPLKLMDYVFMFVFLILYGILQWLFQKNTLIRLLASQPEAPQPKRSTAAATPQDAETDRIKRQNRDKRLFVHLLRVLQREGRLVDFLQADLSQYEDNQIGAAARSIHENCRKTLNRYLSPEPVFKQKEGEAVEIAAGFDPQAVTLVGNVVGQPPFSGILRHRGWQLRSLSLPKLSEAQHPDLIAPAEVEIQ